MKLRGLYLVVCLLGCSFYLFSNKSLGSGINDTKDVFFAVSADRRKAALLYKGEFVLGVDIFRELNRYSVEIIDLRVPTGEIGANNPLGFIGRLLYQKGAGFKKPTPLVGVPPYYQKMVQDALTFLNQTLINIANVDSNECGVIYSSAPIKLEDGSISYLITCYDKNGITKQYISKYRHHHP